MVWHKKTSWPAKGGMGNMRACGDAGFCGVQVWQRVKCTVRVKNAYIVANCKP